MKRVMHTKLIHKAYEEPGILSIPDAQTNFIPKSLICCLWEYLVMYSYHLLAMISRNFYVNIQRKENVNLSHNSHAVAKEESVFLVNIDLHICSFSCKVLTSNLLTAKLLLVSLVRTTKWILYLSISIYI